MRGDEIQVGDDILVLGTPHRVLGFDDAPTLARTYDAPGTRIARGSDGWVIALFPEQRFWVERVERAS